MCFAGRRIRSNRKGPYAARSAARTLLMQSMSGIPTAKQRTRGCAEDLGDEKPAQSRYSPEVLIKAQDLVRRLPAAKSRAGHTWVGPTQAGTDHSGSETGRNFVGRGPSRRRQPGLHDAIRARPDRGPVAPSIDDVIAMHHPILRHRMANFSARAEGATIRGGHRRPVPSVYLKTKDPAALRGDNKRATSMRHCLINRWLRINGEAMNRPREETECIAAALPPLLSGERLRVGRMAGGPGPPQGRMGEDLLAITALSGEDPHHYDGASQASRSTLCPRGAMGSGPKRWFGGWVVAWLCGRTATSPRSGSGDRAALPWVAVGKSGERIGVLARACVGPASGRVAISVGASARRTAAPTKTFPPEMVIKRHCESSAVGFPSGTRRDEGPMKALAF